MTIIQALILSNFFCVSRIRCIRWSYYKLERDPCKNFFFSFADRRRLLVGTYNNHDDDHQRIDQPTKK